MAFSSPLNHIAVEKLPCGASAVFHSMPGAETVHCRVLVRSGSIDEGPDLGSGLSHFLEHMVFHGTKSFPGSADISERVESCGGNLNACTSYDYTCYYMNLPSAHAADGLRMLCDMMRFPLFPAGKFRSEKNVILRECAMCRDNPDEVLYEALMEEIHRESPLRIPIIGVPDELGKVTRERMAACFRRRYSPERMLFVATGKIDADSLRKVLLEATDGWTAETRVESPIPPEPPQRGERVRDISFPDPMARVAIGWSVPAATHPDHPALILLAEILGGGISSRLYRALKTDSMLVSSVYADMDDYLPESLFLAHMTLRPENLEKAMRVLDKTFDDIRRIPVSQRELARAVAQEETDAIRRLDSPEGVAREICECMLRFGSLRANDWRLNAIRSLSPGDLQAAAERWLAASAMTVVRMRPPEAKNKKGIRRSARKEPAPLLFRAANGGRSIFLPDKSLPLIDVALFLPGARAFEQEDESGFSQLISRLLFADNARYREAELAALLDDHAIALSVVPGNNSVILSANCARGRLDRALDAVCSMLEAPRFPEQALERERKIRMDQIRSALTRPAELALSRIPSLLFENHPYGRNPERMLQCIAEANPARLDAFFSRIVRNASGAVLALSGDLSEREAVNAAERIFSAGTWASDPLARPAPPKPFSGLRRWAGTLPSEQAVAAVGMQTPFGVESDEFKSVSLILEACNGMSSHLFQTVRETHGLAYYAALRGFQGFSTGSMTFLAGTEARSLDRVVELLREEARRLADKGFSQDEFDAAKKAVLFAMDAEASKPGARAAASALSEYLGEGFLAPWRARALTEAMTRDGLRGILASIFGGGAAVATVSPEKAQKRAKK